MRKKKVLNGEEIKERNRDKRDEQHKRNERDGALLEFKWTVSRGRNSYGYNICTLYVDRGKRASCNGGGYDMKGTSLGHWIAGEFRNELISEEFKAKCESGAYNYDKNGLGFYGLSYHDPCYDPGKAEIDGKTVEEREKAGDSLGLERYQSFYKASTKVPDDNHFIPMIDGACGFSTVERILKALGYELEYITGGRKSKNDIYKLRKREGKDND